MAVPADLPPSFAVAVDGPSGSGKSSTARGVAMRLGWRYLDTGAMYRGITLWMLINDVDVDDSNEVARHADEPQIEVTNDPEGPRIFIDSRDVTDEIRQPHVTQAVSAVSAVPEVRRRLVALQREALAQGPIVIEGRDIGTVVVPDAPVKVFLVASSVIRGERRRAELDDSHEVTLEDTVISLERRDRLDTTRKVSPLARAGDAVVVDSTDLSLDEVIDEVVSLVLARVKSPSTT